MVDTICKYKGLLISAILAWYDDSFEYSSKGIDSDEWINHVCGVLDISKEEYLRILSGRLLQ